MKFNHFFIAENLNPNVQNFLTFTCNTRLFRTANPKHCKPEPSYVLNTASLSSDLEAFNVQTWKSSTCSIGASGGTAHVGMSRQYQWRHGSLSSTQPCPARRNGGMGTPLSPSHHVSPGGMAVCTEAAVVNDGTSSPTGSNGSTP